MRVKLIGVSDEARKSESVHRAKHDSYSPKTSQIHRRTKSTAHVQESLMVSRREQIVSLNISRQGETQIWSLAGEPDEATQKFTSATGARIPIVNRNFFA